jgi:hypothetical protein
MGITARKYILGEMKMQRPSTTRCPGLLVLLRHGSAMPCRLIARWHTCSRSAMMSGSGMSTLRAGGGGRLWGDAVLVENVPVQTRTIYLPFRVSCAAVESGLRSGVGECVHSPKVPEGSSPLFLRHVTRAPACTALPTFFPVDMLGLDVVPGYSSPLIWLSLRNCAKVLRTNPPYIARTKDYAGPTVPACWLAIIARVALSSFLPRPLTK